MGEYVMLKSSSGVLWGGFTLVRGQFGGGSRSVVGALGVVQIVSGALWGWFALILGRFGGGSH